ncbi:glycosyltransferase N-terminal domain-containing protein [Niabella yanshanensis]|uniref:3-deoxy-D-manno-octulosonic acid transferase n=1 Tax=Niabella yanshanensis TaxID=577386 RepID=A0ABZ0W929_9BACT|nr:glycosyltransferase N-terminal domain-containing protein [Niabella yanshanensis]WQD39785.1 glycosyltransferase N-terminal domain-containing protein [Niabella yanshanensis]
MYNISVRLYQLAILIASLFNKKAKLWLEGRKDIFNRLQKAVGNEEKIIWMHCASLGEFEQGRPVLEQLRLQYPQHRLLLTFFSPSGYEIRKNYTGVDWVFYLPLDTRINAEQFINIVKPSLSIFVKYEYWYHYLNQLHQKNIPVLLISAIFRANAPFFKWYGGVHRAMANYFSQLFVQNQESYERISVIVPSEKITLAGDTRFDRVKTIADSFERLPLIEQFITGKKILVAGSTWPEDEQMLKKLLEKQDNLSLIIAPHEITDTHLRFLRETFSGAAFYSELKKVNNGASAARVLIVDNIGMLSKLYYYSMVSYIGGGFKKSGIHNTLEAAVYGKPVLFGPNYQKFAEAIGLIKSKGAFTYTTDTELTQLTQSLLNHEEQLMQYSHNAGEFVAAHTGATNLILRWLRKTAF